MPLYLTALTLILISCTAGAHSPDEPPHLVRSSCLHATFPSICLRTLSTYPGAARTPTDLARAAVFISYQRASRASDYLSRLGARNNFDKKDGMSAAIGDCLEQLSDAAAELRDTMRELRNLKTGAFRWHMSNAETWVSAALTDQDTCLDGIAEVGGGSGKAMRDDVRRRIKNVAKVTSNALFLINRLDGTRNR